MDVTESSSSALAATPPSSMWYPTFDELMEAGVLTHRPMIKRSMAGNFRNRIYGKTVIRGRALSGSCPRSSSGPSEAHRDPRARAPVRSERDRPSPLGAGSGSARASPP